MDPYLEFLMKLPFQFFLIEYIMCKCILQDPPEDILQLLHWPKKKALAGSALQDQLSPLSQKKTEHFPHGTGNLLSISHLIRDYIGTRSHQTRCLVSSFDSITKLSKPRLQARDELNLAILSSRQPGSQSVNWTHPVSRAYFSCLWTRISGPCHNRMWRR